jgi:flagellar export protein FliJ
MARFQFSLEKVLRWRELELAAEENKLKPLVREQVRLQGLLANVAAERSKLDRSLNSLAELRGEDLRNITAYRSRLKTHGDHFASQLAQCERQIDAQRKKCQEAKQRCRLLEELRKRRFIEWRREQATELEALASESYIANWTREHA